MKCPICGIPVVAIEGDCSVAMNHLESCGVIGSHADDLGLRSKCVCGKNYVRYSTTTTYLQDFAAHCQTYAHDWPKLLTRSAMEQF